MRTLFLCFSLFAIVFSFTLPEGFKRAKDIGENSQVNGQTLVRPEVSQPEISQSIDQPKEEKKIENEVPKTENNGIVILKRKRPTPTRYTVPILAEEPITQTPTTVGQQKQKPRHNVHVPNSANYGLQTIVQTNFVDSNGRNLKNVVAVPIRVGGHKKTVVSTTPRAVVAQVESEAFSEVAVRFGQAPI